MQHLTHKNIKYIKFETQVLKKGSNGVKKPHILWAKNANCNFFQALHFNISKQHRSYNS